MNLSTIPWSRLDPGNALARAYVLEADRVLPLFGADYRDARALAPLAERQAVRPRPALGAALADYNRAVGGDAVRAARIDGSPCVVSGQQVGLLFGPAYTTYKIITLLNAAEVLSAELGSEVVPVFWVESEDHDWDEVNRFFWKGRRYAIDAAVEARTPVARVETDPGPFLDALREVLPASDEAWRLVEPEPNVARWHVRNLARLFAGSGLVFLEPALLREPMRAFAKDIAARGGDLDASLACDTGFPRILEAPRGAYLFDVTAERRRLARGEPVPALWSTDVVSRVLLQNAALPVVMAICGPSEIHYWSQLRGAHEALGIPMPAVLPRDSATLVEEGIARDAARMGLDLEEVVRGLAVAHDTRAEDPVAARLRRLAAEAAGLSAALDGGSLALPANTERPFRRTVTRLREDLEKLAGRLDDARAEEGGAGRRRFERVLGELRPAGGLQERSHSLFPYVARHGTAVVRRLRDSFDPFEFGHYLVQM